MHVALLGSMPLHPAPNPAHTPAGPFPPTQGVARVRRAGPEGQLTWLNKDVSCSGEMLVYVAGTGVAGGVMARFAVKEDGLDATRKSGGLRWIGAGDWKSLGVVGLSGESSPSFM